MYVTHIVPLTQKSDLKKTLQDAQSYGDVIYIYDHDKISFQIQDKKVSH